MMYQCPRKSECQDAESLSQYQQLCWHCAQPGHYAPDCKERPLYGRLIAFNASEFARARRQGSQFTPMGRTEWLRKLANEEAAPDQDWTPMSTPRSTPSGPPSANASSSSPIPSLFTPGTPVAASASSMTTVYATSVKPVARPEELDEVVRIAKTEATIKDVKISGDEAIILLSSEADSTKVMNALKSCTNADGDVYTVQCMSGTAASTMEISPTSAIGSAVLKLQRDNETLHTRMASVEANMGTMMTETRRNSLLLTGMASKMGIEIPHEEDQTEANKGLESDAKRMRTSEKAPMRLDEEGEPQGK